MPTYLVERYIPHAAGVQLAELAAAAKAAAGQPLDSGIIRYLAVTLVPGDELCYCLFEAASLQAVQRAHELAQIPCERIVEAFHATAPAHPHEEGDRGARGQERAAARSLPEESPLPE